MAWIFLAVSEELPKPSKGTSNPLLIVKGIDTPKPFSYHEWLQEISRLLRYGMTLPRFGQPHCPMSILCMEDSHAKTFQVQDIEKAWTESEASFFERCSESLAKYDPDSFSWKTYQKSLIEEGYYPLRGNLPTDGMTVDGEFYPLDAWEPITYADVGGYLPTPMSSDGAAWKKNAKRNVQHSLKHVLSRGGQDRTIYRFLWYSLSPKQAAEYTEWMMGYPPNYTALEPWAMPLIQELQEKHLKD